LQATWDLIRSPAFRPLRIPDHNRAVVERSTHSEALAALAGDWSAHTRHLAGTAIADRNLARRLLMPWEEAYDLGNNLKSLQVVDDLDQRISTRLGLEDRQLHIPDGFHSPFGTRIGRLKLPGHWFGRRPLPPQDEPDTIEQDGDGLLLTIGDWHFHYGRSGLQIT
ncbi:MAG: hypothetical protein ACOCXJ_09750, partial [Planctomycetota bacterium]